jgi:hypothetical protein
MGKPNELDAYLDTCTEVTASLLKLPGGRGGKLPTLTELHSYLSINLSVKRTMRLPMSRQLRVVSWS